MGQQELRRWLPDEVRGFPTFQPCPIPESCPRQGSQGWSFPQALGWDTSIDLSCWLWDSSDYLISVTCSISWGVSQFMHCVKKYFNKVLNWCFIWHCSAFWTGGGEWQHLPVHLPSVIPYPPFQPSWTRIPVLVNNQSYKSPYSVLAMSSLTSFYLFSWCSELFGTWGSLGILCSTVGNGVFPAPPRQ